MAGKHTEKKIVEAMTALRALKEYDDFDPAPYFDMVARNLMDNHGDKALIYADAALDRMHMLGDDEGYELWEEVRAAMLDYILLDRHEAEAPRMAMVH